MTGHIFNTVGSGVKGGGTPGYATYGATKRGLPQLTASLVKELESQLDSLQQNKNEEIDDIKLSQAQWAKKVEDCEEKLEQSLSRHSVLLEENDRLKKSIEKTSSNVSADYDELAKRLEKKSNNERILRGEVAQKKQMISILESNEKHLEDHIASLEEQINKLVSDYESRLQGSE